MGIDHAALREKARQEREARDRVRACNPETTPAPRWGDVGHRIDRRAPWLRGWLLITVALGTLLAVFALAMWLVLWFAQ
jgi:hypothetical protein